MVAGISFGAAQRETARTESAEKHTRASRAMTSDRAKWNEDQVKKFLDAFLEARNNPSYKADKGIKAKGWTDIVKKLNAEFGVERGKAQYKSKLDRIMNDYDLFKYISGLSGVGVCSTTGKTTMGEDAWERLLAAKPKQKARLLQFREEGFEHHVVCSHIAGDARATGESASALDDVLSNLESAAEGGTRVADPPSAQKRKENIKRIRGGAQAEHREAKKSKNGGNEKIAMMKVVTEYFEMKIAQAKRSEAGSKDCEDYDDTGFSPSHSP
ncbi:hypothetical protein DVH05_014090 [Phytophthora capsici]|nr:hypothetical protein DVH05_014090 [Phytophthora capsici]